MDPDPDPEDTKSTGSEVISNPSLLDEKKQIEKYISENKLKGSYTPSGLYVVIDDPGIGEFPKSTSTVNLEYTGYLLNGQKFDGTESGHPVEISLMRVIQGWVEGIPKFKPGGKGKLIIPSAIGYGSSGNGPIPPNSPIVFDIKMVSWK
jgi:FKBP-type peptidyl-prolyl cis-trans isomerase